MSKLKYLKEVLHKECGGGLRVVAENNKSSIAVDCDRCGLSWTIDENSVPLASDWRVITKKEIRRSIKYDPSQEENENEGVDRHHIGRGEGEVIMAKLFILYDARACADQGTEDAAVFCTARSRTEALEDADMFGEAACYSYDIKGKDLINEQWEFDTDSDGRDKTAD